MYSSRLRSLRGARLLMQGHVQPQNIDRRFIKEPELPGRGIHIHDFWISESGYLRSSATRFACQETAAGVNVRIQSRTGCGPRSTRRAAPVLSALILASMGSVGALLVGP